MRRSAWSVLPLASLESQPGYPWSAVHIIFESDDFVGVLRKVAADRSALVLDLRTGVSRWVAKFSETQLREEHGLGRSDPPVVASQQQDPQQGLLVQSDRPDADRPLPTRADDIALAVSELDPAAVLEKYSTTVTLTALGEALREDGLDDDNPCEMVLTMGSVLDCEELAWSPCRRYEVAEHSRLLRSASLRVPRAIRSAAVRVAIETGNMRRTAEEFGLDQDKLRTWVARERTSW